ncbi:MAG: hypothetical protein ACXWPM_03205 [Bdellovibrionota bacterium]
MRIRGTFLMVVMATAALMLGMIFVSGCGSKADGPDAPQTRQDGLPASSNDVEYADGWDSLVINANLAKTVIDGHAHWSSNHNCAQRPVFGAYAPATWNKIAKNMNSAVKGGVAPTPYCVEAPNTTRSLYGGTADVMIYGTTAGSPTTKRTIFEYKDGKVCSTIVDHAVADDLYSVINDLILMADKEDCPFPNWH